MHVCTRCRIVYDAIDHELQSGKVTLVFDCIRFVAAVFLFLLIVADLACAGICDCDLKNVPTRTSLKIELSSSPQTRGPIQHRHMSEECFCCSMTNRVAARIELPVPVRFEHYCRLASVTFPLRAESSSIYHPPRV